MDTKHLVKCAPNVLKLKNYKLNCQKKKKFLSLISKKLLKWINNKKNKRKLKKNKSFLDEGTPNKLDRTRLRGKEREKNKKKKSKINVLVAIRRLECLDMNVSIV